jgi:hypothetical protein
MSSSFIINRIRDSNHFFACITDFYNQIYTDGPYFDSKIISSFLSVNYLSNYNVQQFLSSIISASGIIDPSLYPNNNDYQNVQDKLLLLCTLPSCSQQGDTYTLNFSLNYYQYQTYLKNNSNPANQLALVNGYLQSFFNEKDSTLAINNQILNPSLPIFQNLDFINLSIISVYTNSEPPIYTIQNVNPSDFTIQNYPNYLFCCANFSVDIKSWSTLLILYFKLYGRGVFSNNVCQQISETNSMLPIDYLTNNCIEGNDLSVCKKNIENYCNATYINNRILLPYEKYLITKLSNQCNCYISSVAPVSGSNFGNHTAMCFTKFCYEDPIMSSIYNLSDSDCKNDCSVIKDWVENTDNPLDPGNLNDLDQGRLKQLCGDIVNPYMDNKINYNILVVCISFLVLFPLLMFSIFKHYSFSGTKISIFISIFVILFGYLTYYFSTDLAGIGSCNGKKYTCVSKKTKINLPDSFCNVVLPCECSFDQDCGNGCTCRSSNCIPITGSRPVKTIKVRKTNIVVIIFSIIILVILPVTLIYLHEDYHWKISKGYFTLIIVLLCCFPIAYMIYSYFKKYDQVVFTGPCSESNFCSENGNCSFGEYCKDGNCVCLEDCENKECGNVMCGGNTNCGGCNGNKNCILGSCVGLENDGYLYYILNVNSGVTGNNYSFDKDLALTIGGNNNIYLYKIGCDEKNETDLFGQVFTIIPSASNSFYIYNRFLNKWLGYEGGNLGFTQDLWKFDSYNVICDINYKIMLNIQNGIVNIIPYEQNTNNKTNWTLFRIKQNNISQTLGGTNYYISLYDGNVNFVNYSNGNQNNNPYNNTWSDSQKYSFIWNGTRSLYYIVCPTWEDKTKIFYLTAFNFGGNDTLVYKVSDDYDPFSDISNCLWNISQENNQFLISNSNGYFTSSGNYILLTNNVTSNNIFWYINKLNT